MQAAILDIHGAAFRIASVPLPEPATGEVRVRITASGVNPLDIKIHAGEAAHARHPLPAILGLDLAGTIDAVGDGVTAFRRGDEGLRDDRGASAASRDRSPNMPSSMPTCWRSSP